MVETKATDVGTSLMGDFLAEPAAGTRRVEFSEGTVVYEPGGPAEYLYYIHSGQMRIYLNGPRDSSRLAEILGPGDWFGTESFTSGKVFSSRALAISHTVVSIMYADKTIPRIGRHSLVAIELIRHLANKLTTAREDAAGLVFDDCNARLVKTLLNFSSSAAATTEEDGAINLKITHDQLAQAVGVARETVTLAITQLRHRKLLRTGRNRLIFNPETLRAFSIRSKSSNAVGK